MPYEPLTFDLLPDEPGRSALSSGPAWGDARQVGPVSDPENGRGDDHWASPAWHAHNWGEHGWLALDGSSCAALIASAAVGRIAFTHRALPVVLPVELQFAAASLRFEVGDGALLLAARHAQVVCFQTDSGGVGAGSWSVAVVGHLTVRSEWSDAVGKAAAIIELRPELVTGRQREPSGK